MNKKKQRLKEIVRKNISKLRKEQGLSQEQLGFKTDIHRVYVGFIESGVKSPHDQICYTEQSDSSFWNNEKNYF